MRQLAMIAVMAMVVAGCSSATDEVSEQIVESVSGVDNLDIDEESGEVSFETEQGTFVVGGNELPEGLPFPFPDGYEVLSSLVAGTTTNVVVAYALDRFDELRAFVDQWTASEGGEWQTGYNEVTSAEGKDLRTASWFSETVQISLVDNCSNSEGDDATCLTVASG